MRNLLASLVAAVALAAPGCTSDGAPVPAGQLLQLPPYLVDIDVDRVSGIVGTLFGLTAAATGNASPIAGWEWDFGDGGNDAGAAVQHAYAEPGFFLVRATATDAAGASVSATVLLTVYPAPGAPAIAPGGFELPALLGDVDGDGVVTLADCHLILKHARGLALLPTEEQARAADVDLDGAIEDDDARLLAGAVAARAAFPRRITPDRGPPGTGVNLISPALLDPEAIVQVQVGAAEPVPLFRAVLGFASFLVPFDAGGNLVGAGQAVEVRILVDGVEEDAFDFVLEPPAAIDGPPGAEVMELIDRIPLVFDALRPLMAGYFDFLGATDDERAVFEALLQLAEEEFANAKPQVEEAFALLDDETKLRLHQVAVANGLPGLLSDLDELLDQRATQSTGDTLLEVVCGMHTFGEKLKQLDGIVGWMCNFVQVCALVPGPQQPVCAALVVPCASFGIANDIAGLVIGLAPKPDSKLIVTAEPKSLAAGEQAEIRAYVRFRGTEAICATGASYLRKQLQTQLALRMFKQVGGLKLAAKVLARYPLGEVTKDLRTEVVDKLKGTLDFLVGKVFDLIGINALLDAVQNKVCGALQTAVGPSPFSFPLQNTFFDGPVPAFAGTLVQPAPGSDAPAIYTCQPPDGERHTVTIAGSRVGCGKNEFLAGQVDIECSSAKENVTITMGDNGNALDDIYEVRIGGKTVLTSAVPVVSISKTIQLASGQHTVEFIGRAAPDGIGTYFIQFDGATVVSGPPLVGTNLTAGTVFTYVISVDG